MPLPTFIVVGAMKGGTTSLFNYLSGQPGVSMSFVKETNYFTTEYNRGLEWYESLFPEHDEHTCAVGEASPNYTKRHLWPEASERIASDLPDVKIIFVARDPVERFYSHVVHNYAHGRERKPIKHLARPTSNYIITSMYSYQLSAYTCLFDRDQIMIVDSDNLQRNTADTVREVIGFIKADPMIDLGVLGERHHRSSEKMQRSMIDRRLGSPRLRSVLKRILPAKLSEPQPFERSSFDVDVRARVCELLAEDAESFRSQTGMSFEHWSI